jgi:ribonuclease HII
VKALQDKKLWKLHRYIAGVDEAGRGPLAGPVVACAVVLPRNYHHPDINDSKQLSAKKREHLYNIITQVARTFSFGIVESSVIDQINILNATKRAMKTAIIGLDPKPEIVLTDAVRVDDIPFDQLAIVKGDTLSISIAAASILAKVKRDSIMREYHKTYPQYYFSAHKGYPTRLHRECIRKYGPCAIHRKSFRLL